VCSVGSICLRLGTSTPAHVAALHTCARVERVGKMPF